MKTDLHKKLIRSAVFTRFLGLTIDSRLSWRICIDHLTTQLNAACYVIRSIKPLMSRKTLLLIYHFLFHTVMSYGIIFLGLLVTIYNFFWLQKRVIRIIIPAGAKERMFFK